MSSLVPTCQGLFRRVCSGESGDVFVVDAGRADVGEVMLTMNLVLVLVGNVALVTAPYQDESLIGWLTRHKYFNDVCRELVKMF